MLNWAVVVAIIGLALAFFEWGGAAASPKIVNTVVYATFALACMMALTHWLWCRKGR